MRKHALLGSLLAACVACGGGSGGAASTVDGGTASTTEGDGATAAPSNDCAYGKVQIVFSKGLPPREACMRHSGIMRGDINEAPNAANIIQVSSDSNNPAKERITMQIDRATESTIRTVFVNLLPKTEASYFYAACSASPCAGVQIGPSKVYEGGLRVAFDGLKVKSDDGGGEATLTGTIDAR